MGTVHNVTSHANQDVPYDVAEADFESFIKYRLEDKSTACLSIPASMATEVARLVTSAGLHADASARLADALQRSLLDDSCPLNLGICEGAWLLLVAVAETALPGAERAQQLADIFKVKYDTAS